MTYGEITDRLRKCGIEEAETEAEILLAVFFELPRHELMLRRFDDFSSPELERALRRREAREPLQYVLGEWEFFGLKFKLNRDTLIPRPDTEIAVEAAIARIPRGGRFCDVGTGSGAIAVSVLHRRDDLCALGVDVSAEALCAARENAESNGVAGRFETLSANALDADFLASEQFDAIVSNPPYIPTGDVSSLAPELSYEPLRALDGGEDGLVFYRALLTRAAQGLLAPSGVFICEFGIGQANGVRDIALAHGFSACEILRDLAGRERVAVITR